MSPKYLPLTQTPDIEPGGGVPSLTSCVVFPKESSAFLLFCLIKVCLIYNVVPVSAVQQSDPVIHIYILFFLCYLPSWSIPRDWVSSLCYTAGPHCLSIVLWFLTLSYMSSIVKIKSRKGEGLPLKREVTEDWSHPGNLHGAGLGIKG